jgi:DNA-binding transcriptional ArsR family regulator
MMAEPRTTSPLRLSGVETMRALAHPTRLRMLEQLRREPLSASELARRLEIRFGSARFHLQQLVKGGLAHAAGERRVRGGVELLFSAPEEVRVDIDPAEPATTSAMHHALVTELGRRLRSAATDQRRGDSDLDVVSLREVRLTPDGREEAQRVAAEALRQIRALDTAESDAEPVSLGLFLFRTPPSTSNDVARG